MPTDQILQVITAAIALIGAITGLVVALKQGAIKKTVDKTEQLTNGHHEALKALVQKQGNEMYVAGLPPTQDDSLHS